MQLFEDIDAWYTEALPEPPFYKDGNPQKAIVWFKNTEEVGEFVKRLSPLVALLDKYGVKNLVSRTTSPGEIIYEDQYQVAAK